MDERILIAGAGGQGALTIGKFLATVAMRDRQVTFFPSYGAEVRGGTAHCHVVISDRPIANPHVDKATTLIVMNQMSYNRFRDRADEGCLVVLNSSMVEADPPIEWARIIRVPASQLASEMGELRVANMIMLGATNAAKPVVDEQEAAEVMRKMLGSDPSKAKLFDLNKRALEIGAEQVTQSA